jgi:hypothetical protein
LNAPRTAPLLIKHEPISRDRVTAAASNAKTLMPTMTTTISYCC